MLTGPLGGAAWPVVAAERRPGDDGLVVVIALARRSLMAWNGCPQRQNGKRKVTRGGTG